MASLFDITLSNVTVTEGVSVVITLTPMAALSQAVTVSLSIIGFGRLPITSSDFSTLTGSLSFASGATAFQTITLTPTDDTLAELAESFAVRLSQNVGGTVTDLGDHAVTIEESDGVDKSDYTKRVANTTGGIDVLVAEGTVGSTTFSGLGGDDILIVTRHQYNDVKIDDGGGTNTVKFDFGVEILSFGEIVTDLGAVVLINSFTVTLASGAEITVNAPAQDGQYQYQFGDGEVMLYDAFKAAVTADGVEADGKTLTTPFVVDYPIDSIYGNNVFTGTSADDTLTGTDNADYFHNLGGGSDTVNGLGGNDFFLSDGGGDTFNGGEGIDTVSYANETSGVMALITSAIFNYGLLQGNDFNDRDLFDSIENLIGTDFDDTLNGNDRDNQLEGGGGNDTIIASGGDDILYGGEGNDTLLGGDGSDIFIGGTGADEFNIEDIFDFAKSAGKADIIRDFNPGEGDLIKVFTTNSVSNLTQLYANPYTKYHSTSIEDYTKNGAMDTVMRFDRGSRGIDDSDYLLILEGFTAPILLDYFDVNTD